MTHCAHREAFPWLNRDLHKPYGVRVLEGPTEEPLTLAQAWAHLRLDVDGSPPATDDDTWLETIGIPGARDWCEQYLGGSVAQQTLELATQGFPFHDIPLPFGPVREVVSVRYTDNDGNEQVMDAATYELDEFANPPRVVLAYGSSWPAARASPNSVKVRYITGFDMLEDSPSTLALPGGIRIGLLLMLGHLFINREDTVAGPSIAIQQIPNGAAQFLEPHALRLSMA